MTNRRLRNAYHRLLRWRENHISEKNFILILSLLVGIFTAFAGLLLKWIIHFIQQLLTHNFEITGANFLYLLYPVIGIFITGIFIRRVVRDDISHGITKILYAISMRKSRIKLHNTWTSVVASGVTIGFGGSVAPCRVWCCGGYCRHLQGAHCRAGLHCRGADDRLDDGVVAPAAHLMRHGGRDHLYVYGF